VRDEGSVLGRKGRAAAGRHLLAERGAARGSGRTASIGVSKVRALIVQTRMPSAARSRASGKSLPTNAAPDDGEADLADLAVEGAHRGRC